MEQEQEKVYLLPIVGADAKQFLAPAYVRLLLPYSKNPFLTKKWDFVVLKNNKLPKAHEHKANIIIIERQAAGLDIDAISNWLQSWRAAGKKCVLELDDDLFHTNGLNERTHSGKWEVSQIVSSIKWLASAADAVIVSTPYLKKLAHQYNPHVFLVPNYLDPKLWNIQTRFFTQQSKTSNSTTNNKPIKIGYVGSTTHHSDLAIIVDAMKRIEKEYGKRVEVEVVGAFQNNLDHPLFGKAISLDSSTAYPDFVSWAKENINWDIAVIPLDDVPFNNSKSHLKYLECTALGAACICSRVTTFSQIVKNNKNGLLVKNNTEAWYQAIKVLIEKPDQRKELASRAYQELFDHQTTYANTETYQQLLIDLNNIDCATEVPKVPSQGNILERYMIKHWERTFRLFSKLIHDPHNYFSDSRHVWLRPLRYLFALKNTN